jgi:hypothetical protein
MAPVLPQVDDDPVGSGEFGQQGCGHRIGVLPAPRLPHRGYMIHVH